MEMLETLREQGREGDDNIRVGRRRFGTVGVRYDDAAIEAEHENSSDDEYSDEGVDDEEIRERRWRSWSVKCEKTFSRTSKLVPHSRSTKGRRPLISRCAFRFICSSGPKLNVFEVRIRCAQTIACRYRGTSIIKNHHTGDHGHKRMLHEQR